MIKKDLIIIGGGPSGLCAAKTALESGLSVLLLERSPHLGGQLVKQTHKFFGSKEQYAKTRGYDIAKKLTSDLENFDQLLIKKYATVVGIYPDNVVTVLSNNQYDRYQANAVIIATGASEKFLAFENNDLPGIYGAGAIQTLMNLYGVLPGKEVVMVGSGNIGLIVSYQLMQAGVHVKAIIEASPKIGGYKVHASKVARLGVPILTSTTIKKAIGENELKAIEIVSLDEKWNEIKGTSKLIDVDTLCISVGLTPMHQLLSMVGAQMKYVQELGGFVPIVNDLHQTSIESVFVCGDSFGIEEASSAMMEGYLTGLYVSSYLNKKHPNYLKETQYYESQLSLLRDGPFGIKTQVGLEKLRGGSKHVES
ncbi:MAG: pyridine nucleotide-disulfide oxidoreductase [Tenericutes bacterium HGW-Tenericutes-3]|nr:MAG: pyridine nucleotide-disulfide oxidoreductase [Tenericutes bacterium HGW-Tenericutes-3]